MSQDLDIIIEILPDGRYAITKKDWDKSQKAWQDSIKAAINETKEDDRNIVLNVFGGPSHKCSENSDRYYIQDETVNICAKAILASKIKE